MITIIVLLILAGVALATLTGDSGILSNAEKAKENTNIANIKEKVQLAIMEHKIGQYLEGKTLKEYLEAAGATEVSTSGNKGMIDGYTFEIKDGEVIITKGAVNRTTLGEVYTEELIGQTINYTASNDLPDDMIFKNNDIISDASTSIVFMDICEESNEENLFFDIEYRGEIYRLCINSDWITVKLEKYS